MNYFLLYFSALLISFSIIGYGFIFSKLINKELTNFNIGYMGLLGLLFLVIISYTTIYFVKHDYIHNLILHFFGLSSFLFYFKKKKIK